MASLGTHLALSRDDAKQLFGRREPAQLRQWIDEDLMARVEGSFRSDTADWGVVHRLLGDGTMAAGGGEYPLNHCFVGGRPLEAGEDVLIRVIRPDSVGHIAEALANFSLSDLSNRMEMLPEDYTGPRDDNAATAARAALESLQAFFDHAHQQRCAVVFIATMP